MEARRELARRLARLGMHFEGERLDAAERIVHQHAPHHGSLTDLVLMTICVEAYRRSDVDLPAWV
ncbi:MAG TPA: hypothetical protein VKR80_04465 [Candidatus Limnocylindria bacterium]|nr:hypothetical protein [Candidatus Limnocylindria bacterium]